MFLEAGVRLNDDWSLDSTVITTLYSGFINGYFDTKVGQITVQVHSFTNLEFICSRQKFTASDVIKRPDLWSMLHELGSHHHSHKLILHSRHVCFWEERVNLEILNFIVVWFLHSRFLVFWLINLRILSHFMSHNVWLI